MVIDRGRATKFILLAVLATVAVFLVWAAAYSRSPSADAVPVGVRFLGKSYGPASEPLALFAVTNRARRSVVILAAPPQSQARSGWPTWAGFASSQTNMPIGGKHQIILSVPFPTNGTAWRLPVLWDFKPSVGDHIKAIWRGNWRAFQNGRALPGLGGIGVGALKLEYSDEVPPSLPVALTF